MSGGFPSIALLGISNPSSGGGGGSTTALYLECDLTFAENANAGDIVYVDASGGANAGKAKKSIASSYSTALAIGIVKANTSSGGTGRVYLGGLVPVNFDSAPPASDNGKPVYVSTSASGKGNTTVPSTSGQAIKQIGILINANGVLTSCNVVLVSFPAISL